MRKVLALGLLWAAGLAGQVDADFRQTQAVLPGGHLTFYEDWGSGGHQVRFAAPSSLAATVTYTWPAADGTAGQQLTTDGAGALTWGAAGGSGSAAGATHEIQVNSSGAFGVVSGFSHDGEELYLPRSAGSPSTEGGQLHFQGDTSGGNDYWLDISSSVFRLLTNSGTDKTFRVTNIGAGSLNMQMDGSVSFGTDSLYNIGASATRLNSIWVDDIDADQVILYREGSGAYAGLIKANVGPVVTAYDSGGAQVFDWDTGGLAIYKATLVWADVTPTGTVDLGSSAAPFTEIYGATYQVNTAALPDADGGANLGSASLQFQDIYSTGIVHADTIYLDTGAGVIRPESGIGGSVGLPGSELSGVFSVAMYVGDPSTTTGAIRLYNSSGSSGSDLRGAVRSSSPALEADALAISASGSFYIRTYSGADVSCSGVTDGWMGYRVDTNQIQICDGGAVVNK